MAAFIFLHCMYEKWTSINVAVSSTTVICEWKIKWVPLRINNDGVFI